jgi:hypothetical protein
MRTVMAVKKPAGNPVSAAIHLGSGPALRAATIKTIMALAISRPEESSEPPTALLRCMYSVSNSTSFLLLLVTSTAFLAACGSLVELEPPTIKAYSSLF